MDSNNKLNDFHYFCETQLKSYMRNREESYNRQKANVFARVFRFYADGFRSMTVGKTLWTIILIKLFIMFAILKVFFFPDFLNSKSDDEEGKADYVRSELVKRNQ